MTLLMKKYFFLFISSVFILGLNLNSALADSLGQKVVFNIDPSYDQASRERVSATLRFISEKAYFYLEDSWWQSLSTSKQILIEGAISNLSREFDQKIYPKMTAVLVQSGSQALIMMKASLF
jgi:hypothetical protein